MTDLFTVFDTQLPFAADANYPPGTDPWSGTATKVPPSASEIRQGWAPEQLPAQHLNYVLNRIAKDASEYVLHRSMREWSVSAIAEDHNTTPDLRYPGGLKVSEVLPITGELPANVLGVLHLPGFGGSPISSQPLLCALAPADGGINRGLIVSNDGVHWQRAVADTAIPNAVAGIGLYPYAMTEIPSVGVGTGALLIGNDISSEVTIWRPNLSSSISSATFASGWSGSTALEYGANTTFVGYFGASPIQINTSILGAGVWIPKAVAGWATTFARPVQRIVRATTGSSVLAAAMGELQLAVSTDGGINWTTVNPGVSAAMPAGACHLIDWSDRLQIFICVGENGIATSPNGLTWTLSAPVSGGTPTQWGFSRRARAIRVLGDVVAIVCQHTRDGTGGAGIMYSFDLRNWYMSSIGPAIPPLLGPSLTNTVGDLYPAGARLATMHEDLTGFLRLSGHLGVPRSDAQY